MSLEKVNKSLALLSRVMDIEPPQLDENHNCTLSIYEHMHVHFSYIEEKDQLYIYCVLFSGIDQDPRIKASVFQSLATASSSNQKGRIGAIGYSDEEESIVFYNHISMHDTNEAYLSMFMPEFIEKSLSWKEFLKEGLHKNVQQQTAVTPKKVPQQLALLLEDPQLSEE